MLPVGGVFLARPPSPSGSSHRRPLIERRATLRWAITAGVVLADDDGVTFFQFAGDDFGHSPVGQSGAHPARLDLFFRGQHPDDLTLPPLATSPITALTSSLIATSGRIATAVAARRATWAAVPAPL